MKCFLVLCAVVVLANAEAPRFRSSRLRSRFLSRQEAAPADVDIEITTPPADTAPYPPASAPPPAPYPASGWRPDGPAFELPTEEVSTPDQAYGTPTEAYGPPPTSYGAPDDTPVVPDEVIPLNPDAGAEKTARLRRLKSQRLTQAPNAFFVLLPDSTLRRVNARQARIVQGNQQSRRQF